MLFLGDATLTDGFRLIGFETWSDPTVKELEQVLGELLDTKCNAFVVLDNRLSATDSDILRRVRSEGGRILVAEVPPLSAPESFRTDIDKDTQALLENGSLTR
jgi:vacuolar-type H+-ATPase subunit F/Vma7